MAKYLVRIHPRVGVQLSRHAEFIARVSKTASQKFRSDFAETLHRIQDNPYQFPICDDSNLPTGFYRKALFGTWYKMIFYIEDMSVFIDAVVDCRSIERAL